MRQVIVFILAFFGINTFAQKHSDSYNYQRGVEAVKSEKTEEALDYFNRDLQENDKNGYTYSWIAYIYNQNEEYGKALNAANLAIKYLPKKDAEYMVFAYATRGDVYTQLGDTIKAIDDYTAAIKANPENYSVYEKRGNRYYDLKEYELSDADFKKEAELNPGGTMGYMGLGRNANARERWEEAIKYFDYVTKLASDYSSGYSFRAESFMGLKKWDEATNDLISALNIEWDRKAMYLILTIKEPAVSILIAKMRVQAAKQPNDIKWTFLIGSIYEQNKEYEKAVKAYGEAISKDPLPFIYRRITECHFQMGNFEEALSNINIALNIDSTDIDDMSYKANIYYEMGKPELAIGEWDKVLEKQPDYAWGYYRRGWFKELSGLYEGAIEDLSIAIVLEPTYTYSYSSRGDVYMKLGKKELAAADFNKIIEIEESPEKYECIQYAYQGLGQYDKAMAAMDKIIARDTTDAGSYYDATCVYCRMGKTSEALDFFAKSLELGYKRFSHIDKDDDLDPIRNTDEFKRLIKKYKTQSHLPEQASKINREGSTLEIPFVKENGVYRVQCEINGLPLHFVLDTGASDVTLSLTEANFMMKNGYLSDKDVIGNQRYIDANGDISVGTVVNIKGVSLGGVELCNVRATVVKNQRAPLLLGQSVIGRLGKIEIDNPNRVLKITHTGDIEKK